MKFERLEMIAREELDHILRELPAELSPTVTPVPVFFERTPSVEDRASGLESDLLGLFDPGPGDGSTPRIRLWLENLWSNARREDSFREEVRITLLHEIGHLLGWDEEDLERRGLG